MTIRVAFVRKDFRQETGCQSGHKQPVERPQGEFGAMGWANQPYVYRTGCWALEDDLGCALCDRCVADGLRAGTMELTNPAAVGEFLDGPRDPSVAGAYAALVGVRAAHDDWGGIPLALLERAVEAAERRGTLPALAARLLAATSPQPPPPLAQDVCPAPDEPVAGKRARPGAGFVGLDAGAGPADCPPPVPATADAGRGVGG